MKNKIILLVAIILPGIVLAQNNIDFELWNSAGLKYGPSKKLDLGLEFQYRLKENVSVTDSYFTELTADYEVLEDLEIGLGSRFIRKNDNKGAIQGYENYIRLHIQAKYSYKIERFRLGLRLRYQNKDEMGIRDEFGNFADHYLRLKGGLNYNIKSLPLKPEISGELFHHSEGNTSGLNKYRLTLGVEYDIDNFGELELAFRRENLLNSDLPEGVNILMLRYVYKI